MADIFKYSLDQLNELEGDESLKFSEFNNDIAWKLGSYARELTIKKFPGKAVVIDIALTSGHVLFRTCTASGTAYDNDLWVERKKKLVTRIGKSSFFIGQKLRIKGKSMEESLLISSMEFASHGGCVPIRLKNFDNLIGTLTISGLSQDQDHLLALEVLKTFN